MRRCGVDFSHDVGLDPCEVSDLLVASDLLNRPSLVTTKGRRHLTIVQLNWEYLSVLAGLPPIAAMALAVDELLVGGDPEEAVGRLCSNLAAVEIKPIGARFVRRPRPKEVTIHLESLTWERWPAVLRGSLMRNPGAGAFLVIAACGVMCEPWQKVERAAVARALVALAPSIRVPGRTARPEVRTPE